MVTTVCRMARSYAKPCIESKREGEILDAVDRFFETLLSGGIPGAAQTAD